MERVRVVLELVLLPPALALAAVAALLLALVGAPLAWVDRLYRGFARVCLAVAGTRLEVHGLRHVDPDRAYVIVPNHESLWDPIVLLAALAPLRVRLTGNVSVRRRDTAGDIGRLRDAMGHRAAGTSMLFFAEGTRSPDGDLHAFKKGAFVTAIAEQLAVLPVAIAGTGAVLPPGDLRARGGPVVVEIGVPLAVTALASDDRDALRASAYKAVTVLRRRARERLRFLGGDPFPVGPPRGSPSLHPPARTSQTPRPPTPPVPPPRPPTPRPSRWATPISRLMTIGTRS